MTKAKHVKTASQENLFGRDAEIESVTKPEKKKPNLPSFAKMTGRSARYANYNNTDESPTNIQLDNTSDARALKLEREKYKKLLQYNFVKNAKSSHLVKIPICT